MRRLIAGLLFAAILHAMSGCAGLKSEKLGSEQPQLEGWAADGSGTTGGTGATAKRIYTVHTRREFIAALHDGNYPAPKAPSNESKIIYLEGAIDVNVDDHNRPLACRDYVRDGYNIDAFIKAYDPAVWGREPPKGLVEAARIKSHEAQEERVRIRVGSNTSIVGKSGAVLKGAWLDIQNQSNVIVRNIAFVDTQDCFPAWEPKDGDGAWNSEYDFISVRASEHVWVDHNSFEDGATADRKQPHYFGKHYQVHDGEVDITEGSDLVTVSWNRFTNHDKVMLIGSSDSHVADRDKLRVTVHHNLFANVGQRTPRVRFGQVHVYNNLYRVADLAIYRYSWGVGFESRIYAENNAFVSALPLAANRLVAVIRGAALHESGTLVNHVEVDVVSASNVTRDPDLKREVDWRPLQKTRLDAARDLEVLISAGAGPTEK